VRVRHAALLLLTALALAIGCAGLREPREPAASPEEKVAYGEALASVVDDPAATERRLGEFLRTYPDSPLADDAGVRLGELALKRGDTETARARLEQVVERFPNGDRSDSARVLLARLAADRGDVDTARDLLRSIRLSRLSPGQRTQAYRVMADVSEDPVERLRWLARVRAGLQSEEEIAALDLEIDELLLHLAADDLYRAYEQIGPEIPAARILLKAADLDLDAGQFDRARRAVERAEELPIEARYESRRRTVAERVRLREEGPLEVMQLPSFAEALRKGVPSTREAAGTLGVLLPLSGPFARFGEDTLQGILLAAGIFGDAAENGTGPRIRLAIRDTAGRPERAASAVRELADRDDVIAIVGPMLKAECEAAAAAAEDEDVPLVAITAREEISRRRPHVFRMRTMPEEEVAALVEYAVSELDARRFAILYPRDAYGRGLRKLFWRAVEQRGGRVVSVASYDPEATDFAEPIRRLVGYELLTDGEKQALRERDEMERKARRLPLEEAAALREEARALTGPDGEPLPPIVDFDALFIPESREKVVLIAPQLAFHEATGMRLLGANGWNDPSIVKLGRHHVEGAVFTAHFFAGSPVSVVQDFTEEYERAYASAPEDFAAQGYDAANMLLVQLARGRDTRDAVRDGVLELRTYPGVTGVTTMRADGNAAKRPFLLAVERGEIVQLD
jgi:ABC-type branched-subunit amino acid transport system substrate-binding protein